MQVYPEHLHAAWGLVQRGSPAAGVDGMTPELFAGVANAQLAQMHRHLRRERYMASPTKGFYVSKKKGGQRLIGLSTVEDRILQRYLLQSIYPRLEATFSDSSFAYRPGLSIYSAVDRVMFGACNVSHGTVRLALQRRIPLLYLSNKGRYFGRLETTGEAKIEYLVAQVEKSKDEDFIRRQARNVIVGKLHNSRQLLMKLNRRRKPKSEIATEAIKEIAVLIKKMAAAETVESMLGYEGQGAKLYFRAYGSLLKGSFKFEKRSRRPPTDPVNSLMSLGYTLLSQNVHAMTEAAGLHTHFGNLHVPQSNRPSLVCDLVEEFRAMVVDALVAYLINSNIYQLEDFTPPDERGGVYLHPDALKRFLKHWEEKLQQPVTHPHTGYKVSYRRCFELQVWEYTACIAGEREDYRPMVWRT